MNVDTQSSTICQYNEGISTLQTSWRMLTNPWDIEPQPANGYEIVGTRGSISTRESGILIRATTEDEPEGFVVQPDDLPQRYDNLAHYLVYCLENGEDPEGPADPKFCRKAHRIIESARRSADVGRTVDLLE